MLQARVSRGEADVFRPSQLSVSASTATNASDRGCGLDLRALTGGAGIFTMEFAHYEEVPTHLAAKIVEEAKRAAAEAGK